MPAHQKPHHHHTPTGGGLPPEVFTNGHSPPHQTNAMPTYKIHNEQEFDAVKEIVDDAERIAKRLYAWKNPGLPITDTPFRLSYLPDKKSAWELACGLIDELTGECPEQAVDALNDALNAQIDPCDADRAARLDAA